jgi:microcystin-dependent protein
MSNPYVASILMFAGNFAPRGYAFCDGQLLPIPSNTALFSLIGTYYGGNGTSTFALPNLQGQAAIGQGQGPGLSQYVIGESLGTTAETLLLTEIPSHNHSVQTAIANLASQNTGVPSAATWLGDSSPGKAYTTASSPTTAFSNLAVGITGGGQSHNNVQPVLPVTFCICLQGVFPARN